MNKESGWIVRFLIRRKNHQAATQSSVKTFFIPYILCFLLGFSTTVRSDTTIVLAPADIPTKLREVVNTLQDGTRIQLPAGEFFLKKSLTVIGESISIVGKGSDKTLFNFAGQLKGAEGISARGSNIVMQGFAVKNTAGDGLVVRHSRNVTISDIRVSWPAFNTKRSGGYGIYPVSSRNVRIDSAVVNGASEAGIYLGQTEGGHIANSRVGTNVTGIHIENSSDIRVQDNHIENNAIGLLIAAVPDLPVKKTDNIVVANNYIAANNTVNFSAEASLVNKLGNAVGIYLLASDNVFITQNTLSDHRYADVFAASFFHYQPRFGDGLYNPYLENTIIYSNTWSDQSRDSGAVSGYHLVWDGTVLDPVPEGYVSKPALCVNEQQPLSILSSVKSDVDDKVISTNCPLPVASLPAVADKADR